MTSIVRTSDDYLFSIVMAIYKVEEYLEEAIQSVIKQTLSFEHHVQLILVNDGSPDNSESICMKYSELYPNNIVYIKKENGGVSTARNEGLIYVKGKYVNFLDSDDKLAENALEEVLQFFESNNSDVDLVSIPIFFFDARNGEHILNSKFSKSRVIDLEKEYTNIQLSFSSSFVKSTVIKKYRYNEKMNYAEDAELIARLLLDTMKLGVVSTTYYYYRRRFDESSAIQTGSQNKDWFIQYIKEFPLNIIQFYIQKLGYIPKFIQYTIMYDLQWRISIPKIDSKIMNETEIKDYFSKLKNVLLEIDDEIIMSMKNINIHYKIFALKIKYGSTFELEKVFLKDNVLLYHKNILVNSLKNQFLTIDFIKLSDEGIYFEGDFGSLFDKADINILAEVGGRIFKVEEIDKAQSTLHSLGQVVKKYYSFRVEIPLEKEIGIEKIVFFAEVNKLRVPLEIKYRKFSYVADELKYKYCSNKQFIIFPDNTQIVVKRFMILTKLKAELKFLVYLLKLQTDGSRKAVIARIYYHIVKQLLGKKRIWLFIDRQDKADDNGEYLFKYSVKKKDRIKKYFIIDKKSNDYNRLKKVGNVVSLGSYKHKMLHLLADKVISSHAEEGIFNPFFSIAKYYRDIMKAEFIFLQHGIIKDDLSSWLNKYNKNIKLFVTSSPLEYRSILDGEYYYNKDIVKLVGLPRYDYLDNKNKKRQILLAPTWRNSLVSKLNQNSGTRAYSEKFKHSEYFNKLNDLLNNESLLTVAREKNYSIVFLPHPNIRQQLRDFTINNKIEVADYNVSYQNFFNESSLLITDYSSVAFDFAYLKKPVVYFQFDENHLEKGYYDYEEMGFGEVCNDLDELVDTVINYINNDCTMKDEYINRVNNFYGYIDQNNCKRVYESIKGQKSDKFATCK